MNADLTLVEATVYDNITEQNGRGEVLDALRSQRDTIAALTARVAELEAGTVEHIATLLDEHSSYGENGATVIRDEYFRDLRGLAESVLICLTYPRGSEAQVRCLEEVGQDARRLLTPAPTRVEK